MRSGVLSASLALNLGTFAPPRVDAIRALICSRRVVPLALCVDPDETVVTSRGWCDRCGHFGVAAMGGRGSTGGDGGTNGRSGQGLDRGLRGGETSPIAERHTTGSSAKPAENLIEMGGSWCTSGSWSVLA